MKVSVWNKDLSDAYLTQVTQLGADCIDFIQGASLPGVKEQGYPDLDALLRIKRRLSRYGLAINRVTLPNLTERFMQDLPGAEKELENVCNALRVFGEAGVPLARQRFAGDTYPDQTFKYRARHRGGYLARAESLTFADAPQPRTYEALENWWEHFRAAYREMVPIAEEYGVKLAIHPSDTPNHDTPLGGLGYHRVIDEFPNACVGYLYCCGTRAEAGGSALVLDEIHNYGRKGRIFAVHLRNVRGSLATAGGYEETLLDDGDMNMFKILLELKRVGFDGCLNADHIPRLQGDDDHGGVGLAYSVGYIKGLLAALATVS